MANRAPDSQQMMGSYKPAASVLTADGAKRGGVMTNHAASIAIRPVPLRRKVRIIGNTFAGRVKLVVNGGVFPTRLLTACSKVIGQKIDNKLRQVPYLSGRQKGRLIGSSGVVCSLEATWATRNLLES
jgi:hypothetical protein